jgi:tetratricopeptide (TPR) repeat protein
LPARQKTLEGAIDWSYSLLTDWEQQAVMQGSIFQGGFSWEAAEQVIDLSAFPTAPLTLDVIQSLREKSLLTRQDTRHQARFGMYLSIREYAEHKWRESADAARQAALGQRFARAMIEYAQVWDSRLHTAAVGEALDRLQAEMVNLFAVQDWALANHQPEPGAQAILAVAQTMAIRGPADRRVSRLERSLSALPESALELRLSLLIALSDACQAVGAWDRAVALADQAVELSQSLGAAPLRGFALLQQGDMRRHRGDSESAYTCFVQSESIFRQVDDRQGLARSLGGRGMMLWQRGDSEQALHCYDEATAMADELHDQIGIAVVARHRGHVLWQRGDYNGALKCYAEAERIARELGDDRTIHLTIGNRGIVLADQGDYDGALQCYAEAESIARKLGDKRGIAMNVGNRGIALSDRGDPHAALGCYREAEAINREIQTKFGMAVNIGNRGNALADLGDYDAALASFDEAEALNREMGNRFLISLNIGDRGACRFKMGQHEQARDALRSALSMLDELGTRHSPEYFAYQSLLAQCEQALNNPVVAAILANEALHLAEQLGFSESHPKLRTRGQLAMLRQIVDQSNSAPPEL